MAGWVGLAGWLIADATIEATMHQIRLSGTLPHTQLGGLTALPQTFN